MVELSRRGLVAHAPLLGALAAFTGTADAASPRTRDRWGRTFDGQRMADLGNGRFLNPIMPGDHPDPTIMRDGDDFYMSFSSFDSYPGAIIWRSGDLVNWTPVGPALHKNIGSVWATDLLKHDGKYYLYIPARTANSRSIYVVTADRIEGPWTDPIDLGLPDHIDPGHAVGEDGSRWLFLSGGDRVRLTPDGLRTVGPVEHVYDPWRYPSDWDVEGFAPEGPKITRRGEYYYLITAVGGTAGPPTGHMVIAARSKSIHGPWENCPHNPIVRTVSATEKWWSRGHASLVEATDGSWWMVYHAYENGFWTLGRQTLLDPIDWTKDGWFRARGGDLSKPLRKPRSAAAPVQPGLSLSDDFSTPQYGVKWNFFAPSPKEQERARYGVDGLVLAASGASPRTSSPLCIVASDQGYEIEADIELVGEATAGLLLFYDHQLYCGLGFDRQRFVTHQYGIERARPSNPHAERMRMRLRNDRHIVSYFTSADGVTWSKYDRQMEVSGYHHNVRGGFLMLRPALYAAGTGAARFRRFTYRAL